jgi:hypothetical protein
VGSSHFRNASSGNARLLGSDGLAEQAGAESYNMRKFYWPFGNTIPPTQPILSLDYIKLYCWKGFLIGKPHYTLISPRYESDMSLRPPLRERRIIPAQFAFIQFPITKPCLNHSPAINPKPLHKYSLRLTAPLILRTATCC